MSETDAWSEPESAVTEESERRVVVRFPSNSRAVCSHPLIPKEGHVWSAQVRDVSAQGVGLLLDRSFPPGTILMVILRNPARKFFRAVSVMVMHGRQQEDGHWLLGCNFITKLSDEEVKALV